MAKVYALLTTIAIIAACSIALLSGDNSPICIKYASRYINTGTEVTTSCGMNKNANAFYCRENREKHDDTYYYSHWSDFIRERVHLGSILYTKHLKNMGDKSLTFYNKHDNKSRLLQEKSSALEINWHQWDKKGRFLKGKINHYNKCLKRIIEVGYDDIKKIIAMTSSKGEEISENGCKALPLLLYFEFDSNGNLQRRTSTFHNGRIIVERFTIIEYKDICYRDD